MSKRISEVAVVGVERLYGEARLARDELSRMGQRDAAIVEALEILSDVQLAAAIVLERARG